jgi:hypothetical protein
LKPSPRFTIGASDTRLQLFFLLVVYLQQSNIPLINPLLDDGVTQRYQFTTLSSFNSHRLTASSGLSLDVVRQACAKPVLTRHVISAVLRGVTRPPCPGLCDGLKIINGPSQPQLIQWVQTFYTKNGGTTGENTTA